MRGWLVLVLIAAACNSEGPRPNYAFASSSVRDGNLGGAAGADAICAERAADANLQGTFIAWISTSTATAFSRIPTSSRGWTLVDGTPIADTASDFATNSILAPIARDELGRDIRPTQPQMWTGTASGTASSYECQDWTDGSATELGTSGYAAGTGLFSNYINGLCSTPLRLLCLEVGHSVPVAVHAISGRYAFVSAEVWQANSGLASADTLCGDDATRAGLPGSYLALLPLSTGSAASRFDISGPPWMRVDGAALADTAAGLFTQQYLSNFLDHTADGTRIPDDAFTWCGDPSALASTETCNDWSSVLPSVRAFPGRPVFTDRITFFTGNLQFRAPLPCDSANMRLVCLQQ